MKYLTYNDQINLGFDAVICCFCLTHARHSILDVFFAKLNYQLI